MLGKISNRGCQAVATALIALVSLALLAVPSALAVTNVSDVYTVNSSADPGISACDLTECTLREAITTANADIDTAPGVQDVINIELPVLNSTITVVSQALPLITDAVAINGVGTPPTINGSDLSSVVRIDTAPGEDVGLRNFFVTNGQTSAAGAGVSSLDADLTIADFVAFENVSTASNGGGIGVGSGTVNVSRSTIQNNTASSGGGISIASSATAAAVSRSTIRGNIAEIQGGGILTYSSLTLSSSTLSGNHTTGVNGSGAGIAATAATTISDSTIYGNYTEAAANGGGALTQGADMTLLNTIVAGNRVLAPGGVGGSGNDVYGSNPVDTFEAAYSLVQAPTPDDLNVTQPGTVITGQDPLLSSPPQTDGSTTAVHRPLPTSPVIDKGSSAQTIDQRGRPRPSAFSNIQDAPGGDGSDIGAYEVQIPPPSFTSISPASPSTVDTPTLTGTVASSPELFGPKVQLYTGAGCGQATGPLSAAETFASQGITTGPVAHNTTTTFSATTTTNYGVSLCAAGPNYTQADPPSAATGRRAAALKKCKKKKKGKARKKCRKRARLLPV